jgi:hypothetical protein
MLGFLGWYSQGPGQRTVCGFKEFLKPVLDGIGDSYRFLLKLVKFEGLRRN